MNRNKKNTPHRILLTSSGSGRRIRLVQAFQKALRKRKPPGKLITIDLNPFSPGLYLNRPSFISPPVRDPGFIKWLYQLCLQEKVSAIIPTTDADLEELSRDQDLFKKSNIEILVSPFETIKLCNDKLACYLFFQKIGIQTPAIFKNRSKLPFPVFIKPRFGRGSELASKVQNQLELSYWLSRIQEPLIQELIEGVEYTIDVFLTKEHKPIAIVPRERIATRAGVSDLGKTIKDPALISFAHKIVSALPFIGPINIQCIRRNREIFLTEINPRFSGGISLTITAGADFAEWTLQLLERKKLKKRIGEFTPNLMMMVYEQASYLPYKQGEKFKKYCEKRSQRWQEPF